MKSVRYPLAPQMGAQKCKVSKIRTIICDNFKTVQDRMSVDIKH